MTATQKLEGLTNSYYGYAVFGAALSLWQNGIGLWSLFTTAGGFFLSCLVTWFLGNRLKNKSALWRSLLIAFSAIVGTIGAVGTARMGWVAVSNFSMTAAFYTGIAALSVYMNVKSFRVLTDSSVKAYFG